MSELTFRARMLNMLNMYLYIYKRRIAHNPLPANITQLKRIANRQTQSVNQQINVSQAKYKIAPTTYAKPVLFLKSVLQILQQ